MNYLDFSVQYGSPEDALIKAKERRRKTQEESDELLDRVVALRGEIKEQNMHINFLKRIIRENSIGSKK